MERDELGDQLVRLQLEAGLKSSPASGDGEI